MAETESVPVGKKPDWDSLKKAFPAPSAEGGDGLTVTESPDGKVNATLTDTSPDKTLLKRFHAMTNDHRKAEYEFGQNQVARTLSNRTKMRSRTTGEVEEIPEGFESPAQKRKFHGSLRNHWNRWSAPKESRLIVPRETRIYSRSQWMYDCPLCGYRSDRHVRDHVFGGPSNPGGLPFIAGPCSRCRP